jgi:integrase
MQERKPVLPIGTTFHQLRKTANTRLVERGVDPKTSTAVMGHGVGISLDIYTAVTPRMKEHAADVMDEDEEYG